MSRNPSVHPQFRTKIVCKLSCKHCTFTVSLRGMKAILLGNTKVELYSTDSPPSNVQLVENDYLTGNCRCRIRDIACLGCGNVCGYHVTQPCERCLESCNNGHFWMFHSDSVLSEDRMACNKKLLWEELGCARSDPKELEQLMTQRALITLRTYQKECVDASIAHYQKGIRKMAVSLPVGSGKTVVFSNLIKRLQSLHNGKTLILAHREELLSQAYTQCRKVLPDSRISFDQGIKKPDMASDIIIASINTLGRKGSNRLAFYNPNLFKTIIVDEAHHAAAQSYTRIIDHFKIDDPNSRVILWGCSATLRRHDGLSLGTVFDKIVFQKHIGELISDKYLSDIVIEKVKTNIKLDKLKVVKGEYTENSLIPLINVVARNRCIVEIYKQQAAMHKRKSTLVFAANVQHIRDLVDAFRSQGIDARGLSGTTPSCLRSQLIQDFKSGGFPVLINCGILTEGTDIPPVDCVLLARPTRSAVLLQQMLGRGLRLSQGKDYCLVLDFEDCINNRIMKASVPSLFGLNNNFETNGELISKIISYQKMIEDDSQISSDKILEAMSQQDLQKILTGAIDGTNAKLERFMNPFSLESLKSDKQWISSFSDLSWVRVRTYTWALNLTGHETLTIHRNGTNCNSKITEHGNFDCFSRIRYSSGKLLFTHDALESAFSAVCTYVVKKFGYKSSQKFRTSAEWRKLPISAVQKKLLQKWDIDIWDGIKRGEASDLLLKRQLGSIQETRKIQKQEKQMIKAKFL